MSWGTPWAWAGLAGLALPILIHLLHRAPARRQPFPSLRFVDASRLPPRRRTRLHDVPLLLVRLAILTFAVLALAGPMISRATRAPQSPRVVRAIVLDTSPSMHRAIAITIPDTTPPAVRARATAQKNDGTPGPGDIGTIGNAPGSSGTLAVDSARRIAASLASDGATAMLIATAHPRTAVAGAVRWLATQTGAGEIVIVSDFQRGTIDSADVQGIPAAIGVRLIPVDGAAMRREYTMDAPFPARSVRVRAATPTETEFTWLARTAGDTSRARGDVVGAVRGAGSDAATGARVVIDASATDRASVLRMLSAVIGDRAATDMGTGTIWGASSASGASGALTPRVQAPRTERTVRVRFPATSATSATSETSVTSAVASAGSRAPDAQAASALGGGDTASSVDRDTTTLSDTASAWMTTIVAALSEDALLAETARDVELRAVDARDGSDSRGSGLVVARNAAFEPVVVATGSRDHTTLELVVHDAPNGLAAAALFVALERTLHDTAPDPGERDPERIDPAVVRRWNRSADTGALASQSTARPAADESNERAGDEHATARSLARWFWLAALLLLGIETWMRRRADGASVERQSADPAPTARMNAEPAA